MKIIFDYNRTLFNPDTSSLYEGVSSVLENLSKRHDLFLVSKFEPGRQDMFKKLSIARYFQQVAFVEKKTKELFIDLVGANTDVLVIGDRVKEEITIGNQLGYITVWIKQGKFADELPANQVERPQYIISNVAEITSIISKYEK